MVDLITKLQESGLTKREANIYIALLQKKEFGASEIASIVPVGRTKIYEIIPALVAKGLCSELQINGKKIYRAVEPEIAFRNLIDFQRNEFEKTIENKIKSIKEIEESLNDIYASNKQKSDSLDYIEIIKDKNQIKSRFFELQKDTKAEFLAFNKAPYTDNIDINIPYEQELLEKNKILGKGIYEYKDYLESKKSLQKYIKIIESFEKLGEEVRLIEELPMKLIIIDAKITVLALNDSVTVKPAITTVIIKHENFAKAQKAVFESCWIKSITLSEFKKLYSNFL